MSVTLIRRLVRATLIGALTVMSSALFLAPAMAETPTYLRLAHLSPDTPEVDVYVASVADPTTSTVVLRGVGYGTLSDYQELSSGPYIVSMRPAGAAPTTAAVIATTLEAAAGSAYTVAGVGTFAELGLTVLTDDLTLPPDGQARARVIQAAASESQLDITIQGGASLGTNVDFATTTPYRNVTAGQWLLRVSTSGQTLAEMPITVAAGAVYSVLILDTPTGLTLAMQVDAIATGVVPPGGVETGGGWLATGSLAAPSNALLSIAVVLSGLALLGLAGFLAAGLIARPRARDL